jgi:hypothetical protein
MLDDPRNITLREAVKAAWRGAGSTEEAVDRLLEAAEESEEVYRALVGPYLRQFAFAAIGGIVKDTRDAAWARPTAPDARADALAQVNAATLYDFPLPGGKRLGDATAEEIAEAAQFYLKQANDMAWKSRWLSAVAAKIPKGKIARKALTVAALAEMKETTK